MKVLALIFYTIESTFSQKITLSMLAAMVVLLTIIIFTVHIDSHGGIIQSVSIFGSRSIAGSDLPLILPKLVETYSALIFIAIIVLGVVATAHILPEIINSQSVTLYITKPISRHAIIISLFLGVIATMMFIQIIFVLSLCGIITAKTGIWNWHFSLSVIPLTVSFSTIYGFMVYLGVISKNTGIVTAIALGHVLVISHLISVDGSHLIPLMGRQASEIVRTIIRVLLPSVHELQNLSVKLILSQNIDSPLMIISTISSFFYLWLSIRVFRRMDF